jgi:hypothetical protein
MSELDNLMAELNREPSNGAAPEDPAAFLSKQLGVAVTGAHVFGRGPTARVEVALAEGRPLTFEHFGDVAKPAALAAHLVTLTGTYRTFKGPEAGAIAAAIFRLAEHHAEDEANEQVREWGREYLRVAPMLDVDMDDQADRWRAFADLARREPARDAGEDRSAYALAAASLVLVNRHDGRQFVRTGWFSAYVKREAGGLYSPASLAAHMEAVGWARPNSEGRIKATSPTEERTLAWRFYLVPADWQVPAGSQDYARTCARPRGPVGTPAGTGNPEQSS